MRPLYKNRFVLASSVFLLPLTASGLLLSPRLPHVTHRGRRIRKTFLWVSQPQKESSTSILERVVVPSTSTHVENRRKDDVSSPTPLVARPLNFASADTVGEGSFEGTFWRGVVVVLCALWASNFPASKLIMAEPGVDYSLYALARFSVSVLALAPFAFSSIKRSGIDAKTVKDAAICGSWVAFGYLGQLFGLLTTTASRSCVICSLHCVFVAAIAEWTRVSKSDSASFDSKRLAPAALAVIGVGIVELQGAAGAPTIGDALSFAQPIGFGMGYLTLEEIMCRNPSAGLAVSAIKLGIVALAALSVFELSPLLHAGVSTGSEFLFQVPDFSPIMSSPIAVAGVLYTGLVTTALALWVESVAFSRVPATDASIILTTEPLFAAVLGAVSLGETFGLSDYVGASLIIGACVLAVLFDNYDREECLVANMEDDQPRA